MKKMFKCLAAIACAVLCVALMAGCASEADQKEQALQKAGETDMAEATQMLTADDYALLLDGLDTATLDEVGVDSGAFAKALMDKFSLEVKSVTVDGDTGTVLVRVTSINQSTQLKSWIDEMTEWSQSDEAHQLYADEGDEAVDSYIADALLGVYTDESAVTKTVEQKLAYTWSDGAWTMDEGIDAFVQDLIEDLDFTSVL